MVAWQFKCLAKLPETVALLGSSIGLSESHVSALPVFPHL